MPNEGALARELLRQGRLASSRSPFQAHKTSNPNHSLTDVRRCLSRNEGFYANADWSESLPVLTQRINR